MGRLVVFSAARRTDQSVGLEGGEVGTVQAATEQAVHPATQLVLTTQPSGAADSFALSVQPVVEVRNDLNAIVTAAVFGVTATVLSGSGTLVGTTTVNTVNGVATFTTLQLTGGSGSHTLRFTATGLASADSSAFVVAQTPTKLVINRQPSGGADGVTFATQPIIEIQDAQSQKVSSSTKTVTVSLVSGTGTLSGNSLAAVLGVATFSGLKVSGASGSRTLRFSATNVAAVDASPTTIAQTATQLVITTQPSPSVTSGQSWPVQPVVEVRDGQNVKVASATNAVTVSRISGTANLLGTLTANAVAGVATFAGLNLVGTGADVIQVDASGLTGAVANTVTIASSPALLLQEDCEDNSLLTRGWYDDNGQPFTTVTTEHAIGGRSMQVAFPLGGTKPAWNASRHLISPATSFYLTYLQKVSANYVGSGEAFHPHEFEFLTDQDGDDFQSLAINALGIYMEGNYNNGIWPTFSWQDASNIDTNNIGVDLTNVTESRAVAGCNGNAGAGSTGQCFNDGGGYQNAKTLKTASAAISAAGKVNWHRWEWYFQLNTIAASKGVADGIAQCWIDGAQVINYTNVLFRTNLRPNMKFNQLVWQPYIGDGSPVAQQVYYDDIKVYTFRPSSPPLVAGAVALTTQPSGAPSSGVAFSQQPVVSIRTAGGTVLSDSTMSVTASVSSGTATLSGTTTVVAVDGVATFTNLALTGAGSNTLRFTCNGLTVDSATVVLSAGGFTTPNLVNQLSFETGWDGLTDWSLETAPTNGWARSQAQAYDGTWSISHSLANAGQATYTPPGSYDEMWVAFRLYITSLNLGDTKFIRWNRPGGSNFGGLWINGNRIEFGFDDENSSILSTTGLGTTLGGSGAATVTTQYVLNAWQHIEVHYSRNTDTYPYLELWYNGVQVCSEPGGTGHSTVHFFTPSGNASNWQNKKYVAGERAVSTKMTGFNILPTVNTGTSGTLYIDKLSVSTVGRIGVQ